ncbi:hypothetical protein HYT45_02805 [Candidatus Uhrbacteria bacterium]|nr:hypothetical protein [Candidatus Uhrbacteria bacterium]
MGQENYVSAVKLGIKFWLYLIPSIFLGAADGFISTKVALKNHLFWQIAIGACLGLASGLGILFRLPAPNATDGAIARYGFWPSLALGTAFSLGAMGGQTPVLAFAFSNIIGFASILSIFLWSEYREKK